ncbi:Protein unc-93 homolog A [Eumeta japonica]|uniref:Protein unc-93 homolog A n=1 Tax=Eumeta variegata TaxID=151549 RepID=A0A4C1TUX2_EUMVA|nr:Protein unc-93 homolog A [Eumeta japonica]
MVQVDMTLRLFVRSLSVTSGKQMVVYRLLFTKKWWCGRTKGSVKSAGEAARGRMGSLPDLTERPRPAPRTAARTASDPNRHRTHPPQPPPPLSIVYAKEWSWRRPTPVPRLALAARRKDSVASSLGAASPFTALVGAGEGALAVALMHATAALVAPISPLVVRKVGPRLMVGVTHAAISALLAAHALDVPAPALWPLYGLCGATLAPTSLALSAAAVSLSTAAGEESRRRAVLRRTLRALRASQDAGLILGALLLGGALALWPGELAHPPPAPSTPTLNYTVPRWPPPRDDFFLEDDYEEHTCGAAGCPNASSGGGSALTSVGRRALLGGWAALAAAAAALGAGGATPGPSAPVDARSPLTDPRALLAMPMGLFIGLQQGFIYTSYVKWYGVCVGGWWCAWRALGGAGALQALAAATTSMAAAGAAGRGRRGALAAGGAAAQASLLLALLRWRAARTDLALPAVAAAAWGACAALWDVLQASVCVGGGGWRGAWGLTLAARHAGLALACAARRLLCVRAQLATLGGALLVALIAHATLELRLRKTDMPRHRS